MLTINDAACSLRVTRNRGLRRWVLVVSPAPGVGHQRASYQLHRVLAQAAIAAGADAEVLEAVNVALPGGKLLVPDVVGVAAGAIREMATGFLARCWPWWRLSIRRRCRWARGASFDSRSGRWPIGVNLHDHTADERSMAAFHSEDHTMTRIRAGGPTHSRRSQFTSPQSATLGHGGPKVCRR
jgi:hypothetical protein